MPLDRRRRSIFIATSSGGKRAIGIMSSPPNASPFSGDLVALSFALFANMVENLIQAANIVGSVFYGVPLAMFLVAFFIPFVGGDEIFCSAIVSQVLVIVLYFKLSISYLWYNLIGCAACVVLSIVLRRCLAAGRRRGMRLSTSI